MSLGLTPLPALDSDVGQRHKSAGVAFLLSFFFPGVGQLYCGVVSRGCLTLFFYIFGFLLCFVSEENIRGVGLALVICLWVFGFLDAYFTAREINQGISEQVDVSNPRVAVVLNLLTAGLGYFYLGERTKGIVLFILLNGLKILVRTTSPFWSGVLSLLTITVGLVMAADAYRLAKAQVREAIGDTPKPLDATISPSRLPVIVPIGLAVLTTVAFCGLAVVGLAIKAARLSDPSLARGRVARAFNRSGSRDVLSKHSMVVADFLPAVQDIQRIQRVGKRDETDLQNLENDTQQITAALNSGELDESDSKVAYFYRGQAGAMSNSIRRKQSLKVDVSVAENALDDFNKVISQPGNTYDPAVTSPNAQYWAGLIQRNDLKEESDAYSTWEKCAQKGHPGCVNIMANAHITGKGGQPVDIPAALNMHLSVYRTGTRSHCAGAYSARSIAQISHFTGVRPPEGDELDWLQKAYVLIDKLPAGGQRDLCGRSAFEIEEFLYRLGRGERRDSLLPDAQARLDDSSPAPAPRALIDLLTHKKDKSQFVTVVESDSSEDRRCSAYFDAFWYAQLLKNSSDARDYLQRMTEIGDFYCGTDLVYAHKLSP